MITECVSPWYNCNGWLGVKHQVTTTTTPAEHSGGHSVQATVHWQMHSIGWEDCVYDP